MNFFLIFSFNVLHFGKQMFTEISKGEVKMKTDKSLFGNIRGSKYLDWLQQSLFTRSAESYFDPIIKGLDETWGLSEKYRRAQVIQIENQGKLGLQITIRPPASWRGFKPGQFVSCGFEIDGVRRKRSYSICSSPLMYQEQGLIQLCVHRVEDGIVSKHLVEELRLNQSFYLSEAQGELGRVLNDLDKPVLFLAAGSGITPFISMLKTMSLDNSPASLIYSCSNSGDHSFQRELENLERASKNFYLDLRATKKPIEGSEKAVGRLNTRDLKNTCERMGANLAECEVFICGGSSFTENMIGYLNKAGVQENQIHSESFDGVVLTENIDSQVRFTRSNKQLEGQGEHSLLEQAEGLGLSPKSGCRMGVCRTCTCTKKSGVVRNMLTGELSGADEEQVRICVSQAVGRVDLEL